MQNLLRYCRRNRKKIIIIVLEIVFVILLVQILNYFVEKGNLEKSQINITKADTNNSNNNSKVNTSVVMGEKTDQQGVEESTGVIKKFFDFCNSKNIIKAYELLSEECKEVMYPTLDDFENNYYSYVFDEEKIYDLQNWITYDKSYTYRISIMSDILATGEKDDNVKNDYITIIKDENGERKINIGGYIGRTKINKTIEIDNIEILVNYKDVYMDCEIYSFTVKNMSKNTVLLNRKENLDTLYLKDTNGIRYSAYLHEISNNLLVIRPRNY